MPRFRWLRFFFPNELYRDPRLASIAKAMRSFILVAGWDLLVAGLDLIVAGLDLLLPGLDLAAVPFTCADASKSLSP